jgi:hypothetical protein
MQPTFMHQKRKFQMSFKTRTTVLALVLAPLLTLPCVSWAGNSKDLLEMCRPFVKADAKGDELQFAATFQTGQCWGTFDAIAQFLDHFRDRARLYGVCAPPTIDAHELAVIFARYAERNPQLLREDPLILSLQSLVGAYPCKIAS